MLDSGPMSRIPIQYNSKLSLYWIIVYAFLVGCFCFFAVLYATGLASLWSSLITDRTALAFNSVMCLLVIFSALLSIKISWEAFPWQMPGTFQVCVGPDAITFTAKHVSHTIKFVDIAEVAMAEGSYVNIESWFGRRKFAATPALLVLARPDVVPQRIAFPLYSMPVKPKFLLKLLQDRVMVARG